MNVFLIQTNGEEITRHAEHSGADLSKGPRFCDELLTHHQYFNADPYWKQGGFDRHDAWRTVESGDRVLLYCSSSVEEHGACLSHVLPVTEKRLTDGGALLRFDEPIELTPKLDYAEIHRLVDQGRFSDRMRYCGQQGFNFTQVDRRDLETVQERTAPIGDEW